MSKVDATSHRVSEGLANLQPAAISATSRSALDQAVAASTEFSNVDGRIRGYLKTGAQSMAAQIVFAEGAAPPWGRAKHIEQARLEEHLELDRFEADNRKLEMAAAGGSVGFMLLVTALLALVPRKSAAEAEPASVSLNLSAASGRQITAAAPRGEAGPAAARRKAAQPRCHGIRPGDQNNCRRQPAPVPLQAVAQICTDMGRVGDPEELKGLLSRAAEALDASGLVLWLGASSGSELRPALAHGYTPEMVSRIPVVPRAANNAAAAAYRSGSPADRAVSTRLTGQGRGRGTGAVGRGLPRRAVGRDSRRRRSVGNRPVPGDDLRRATRRRRRLDAGRAGASQGGRRGISGHRSQLTFSITDRRLLNAAHTESPLSSLRHGLAPLRAAGPVHVCLTPSARHKILDHGKVPRGW